MADKTVSVQYFNSSEELEEENATQLFCTSPCGTWFNITTE